jgi:hypothetical protein
MLHFNIDPCCCYSAPCLTWQAGLKFTNIELDLLPNIDLILFFEGCIRGGIYGVMGSRYAKTDDEYKLLYVDANNLYGWAVMESQPYGGFKCWRTETETEEAIVLKMLEILTLSDDNPTGYFLEVDLEYPDEIKTLSKNFPYCPEKLFIPDGELSEYQRRVLGDKKRPKVEKLILTQKNKYNYAVHYIMLKFYLKQGMILI